MHPRISVNALSSWHWTLQQDIAHWAAAGITRVGVPLATVDADPDGVRRLQEAPVVVDNVVVSKVFTLGDDSCWPSEQDHLRAQLDVAAALGARVCYVTTGPSRSRMTANESIDAFCRAVTPMVDEARRRGVVLAVEQNHAMTHEAGCIHSFRDLRMVADRTGIGMVVEVQNCWQDYGISDALREAAADVALVQVSDFVVGTETRLTRACPGDGDIPLAPILGALVDGGYPATFDIEVLGPLVEAMGYPVAIERSLRWLTAFLETTSSADETVGSRAVQMYGARVQGVCCMTNVTTERRADVADEAGMGFAGDMLFAPDEHEFRAEFRRWLDDNPPPRAPHAIHQTYVDEYLAWYRVLSAAGYGALHWPVEHGGGGQPIGHQIVQLEELAMRGVDHTILLNALHMVGPLLIALGSDEQRTAHLRPILEGRELWSQFLSEPGAGSDLAAVSTRGEVDGDKLVLNGQKVWTTWAQFAHWGLCLCRTGDEGSRHRGLTLVMVDLSVPGLTVRPIRQMDGDCEFNEVFLDDVVTDLSNVIGEVNDGWKAARALLGAERTGLSVTGYTSIVSPLLALRAATMGADSPMQRQAFATLWTDIVVHRLTALRTAAIVGNPEGSLYLGSLGKLHMSFNTKSITRYALEQMGTGAFAYDPTDVRTREIMEDFLRSPASGIGGGTTENQKNAIAERGLGLPRG